MWERDEIEAQDATTTLCSDGQRLFWLERQTEDEPFVDSTGRERRRTTLIARDIESGARHEWATDLPPSDSLAACASGVYLWGLDRDSLIRVGPEGRVNTIAEFDTVAEGSLACVGERLFYLGRTRPRQMGVAVFDDDLGDFAQVITLDDPTQVALQRMQLTDDGVWSLQHDARGWVMHHHPIDGEPSETLLSEDKLVLRWMARTDEFIAVGADNGVHLFEDDDSTFIETDVPPDDLTVMGDRVAWVSGAMTDGDGALVEPWRVMSARPGDQPEVVLETDNRIAALSAGDWGCAVLTQRTSEGLADFIEGKVETGIVLARST